MPPTERASRAGPYRAAVMAVVVNRRGLLFAGRRIDVAGAWQLPQGGMDAGETPADAARRELREETGIASVTEIAEMPAWVTYDYPAGAAGPRGYRGQRVKGVLFRFDGEDGEIDLEANHPEVEFEAWEWVTPATLLDRIVDFKRPLYEAALAAFGPRLGTAKKRPGPA